MKPYWRITVSLGSGKLTAAQLRAVPLGGALTDLQHHPPVWKDARPLFHLKDELHSQEDLTSAAWNLQADLYRLGATRKIMLTALGATA